MTANEILTLTVSTLSFLAAAGAAYYAKHALMRSDLANRIAESSVKFQVLWPTLNDYMSTDMYVAIGHLWAFYSEKPDTLKARYKWQREADLKAANAFQGEEYSHFVKNTLDHHRRRVGQFYGLLKAIHDEGGDQRKWVYTYWRRRELEILPKIIIPLEEALGELIGTPASRLANERLLELYNDCPG
jgi:hypothetical protein